jgi:hypothetical protein
MRFENQVVSSGLKTMKYLVTCLEDLHCIFLMYFEYYYRYLIVLLLEPKLTKSATSCKPRVYAR